MLQQMRQNTKIILWVVVISFVVTIFAVWGLDLQTGNGSSDPNVIGMVNGVPITRSQYQFVYNQMVQQFKQAAGDQEMTYAQQEFIETQAWDNLVYGILTDQVIDDLGITVSDEEIVAYLRNSPPVEIRPYFLDDKGNFDNDRYQAELNNPNNDWTSLEQLARQRIPRVKLNEYLTAQVEVSEAELRRAYELESVDLSLRWVEFPFDATDLGDFTPSDQEINDYYERNKDDFQQPERARIGFIQFPLIPSSADMEDARITARRLRDRIAGGEDFGELAKTFSEAPTAFVEGNTGFITSERREPAYFEALDKLEPGELSPVVEATDGYYLLQLVEKRAGKDGKTEYNANEILVTAVLSRQTTDSLHDAASAFRDAAVQDGFDAAASAVGLTIHKPEPFAEDGFITGIGFSGALSRFAFGSEPGAVSTVLRDDKNLYVGHFVEKLPESYRNVEDARDQIVALVTEENRRNAAQLKAGGFYQKARTTDFGTALKTYGLEVQESGIIRGTDDLGNFGPGSAVVEAALSITPGQTCPPIEWRREFVVFDLLTRSPIDPDDYRAKIDIIRSRLVNQKAQEYVQSWYENLKEHSTIEDYRTQG